MYIFISCGSLGSTLKDDEAGSNTAAVAAGAADLPNYKSQRPSLAKILLSLEGSAAKQQALAHVLQALQIKYAR